MVTFLQIGEVEDYYVTKICLVRLLDYYFMFDLPDYHNGMPVVSLEVIAVNIIIIVVVIIANMDLMSVVAYFNHSFLSFN